MIKQLGYGETILHPEWLTELHENRRGRRELEVTRKKRVGVQRGDSSIACNQLSKCSTQSGAPREIHREKRRVRKEIEM